MIFGNLHIPFELQPIDIAVGDNLSPRTIQKRPKQVCTLFAAADEAQNNPVTRGLLAQNGPGYQCWNGNSYSGGFQKLSSIEPLSRHINSPNR
jgi:hypothetical protein